MTTFSTRVVFDHIRNTEAGFAAANPILGYGVIGLETDSGRAKIGDGQTAWNSLVYFTGEIDWAGITDKPSTFAPAAHQHIVGDVTGLQAALDGKQAAGAYATLVEGKVPSEQLPPIVTTWDGLTGKPSTFPPSSHGHAVADVAGLQTALDSKQPAGSYAAASHTHTASAITDFSAAVAAVSPPASWDTLTGKPSTFPPSSHNHDDRYYTQTQTDTLLAGKQAAGSYVTTTDSRLTDARTPTAHQHPISDVTGLQTALDGKQASGSYAATTHTHGISDVTGLQTALDAKATPSDVTSAITAVVGAAPSALNTLQELAAALDNDASFASTVTTALAGKAAAVHTHVIADVTGLQTALDGKQVAGSYAAAVHTHGISDVTGLQTALDGKAASTHSHAIADVTGLQTALDGKQASGSYAAATHSHAVSDVTGLQTALDGKAAVSHAHSAADTTSGVFDLARIPYPAVYPVRAVHVGGNMVFDNYAGGYASPAYGWGGSVGDLHTIATMQYPATSVAVDVSSSATAYIAAHPGVALTYASLEVALIDAANRIVGWGATSTLSSLNAPNGTAGTSMTVSLLEFPTLSNAWMLGGGSTSGTNAADIAPFTAYKLCQSRYLDQDRTDWANIPNKPTFATVATSGSAADLTGTLPAARLPATTVTAGSYGSASSVGTFTVDAAGRLTAAGSTSIAITSAQVSGLGTLATQSGTFSGTSSGTNTGDQTITLQGDVTGSGTGTFTATIANGSITDAKITSSGLSASSINWAAIADWQPSTAYAKGDLVNYLGVAYRRSAAGTSGATFTSANWQQVTPSTGSTSSTLAIGNHAHGNLTNDGKVGTTSGQILVTTTGGAVTTAATVPTANLGSGTASSSTYLRGDQTYATPVTTLNGSTGAVTLPAFYEFTRTTKPSDATGSNGSYTWTVPTGARFIMMEIISGGGGGGSGRRGAATTARGGGGGGGSGGRIRTGWVAVSQLESSTLTITVGAGGGGGASRTADDTDGAAGSPGGASVVASSSQYFYWSSNGGTAGGAGTTSGGAGGTTPVSTQPTMDYGWGGAGGAGGATASPPNGVAGGNSGWVASGGGGGGGINASDTIGAGGNGGWSNRIEYSASAQATIANSNAGTNGNSGWSNSGAMAASGQIVGIAGTGGNASKTGNAGNGGDGVGYGAPGGGGGASLNATGNSGAGGNGSGGYVRIVVI